MYPEVSLQGHKNLPKPVRTLISMSFCSVPLSGEAHGSELQAGFQ